MHKIEFNRVVQQADKKLIGMAAKMSILKDATPRLWQRFMPRRSEIQNSLGPALYSVQNFAESGGFQDFTPETVFEKWAAIEVEGDAKVPEGMQSFVLRGGHFAVFDHQGPPSEFPKTLSFIFTQWLPQSEWSLDNREHFEILLPDWRPDDPEAREEVWIPLKK